MIILIFVMYRNKYKIFEIKMSLVALWQHIFKGSVEAASYALVENWYEQFAFCVVIETDKIISDGELEAIILLSSELDLSGCNVVCNACKSIYYKRLSTSK